MLEGLIIRKKRCKQISTLQHSQNVYNNQISDVLLVKWQSSDTGLKFPFL